MADTFDPINIVKPRVWLDGDRDAILKSLCRWASNDGGIRYNLTGVYFDPAGAAVATDGHRLLVVRGISGRLFDGKIAAINRRRQFTLETIDSQFPNWRMIVRDPSKDPIVFSLKQLALLRRARVSLPLGLTDGGAVIGHHSDNGLSVQMAFLADLPVSDSEEVIVSGVNNTTPVIVRPQSGVGWFAVIMPVRTDAASSPLTRVRGAV